MAKKKVVKQPKGESLLVELLTEELPPKSLKRLSEAFTNGVVDGLKEKQFVSTDAKAESFATPRRLAVRIPNVIAKQTDRNVERKGPSVQAGLDASGQPTPALLGFARSCNTDVAKLERRKDDKGEYFVYQLKQKGEPLAQHLSAVIETALKKLPVAKLMRWGALDVQFVRPVHGLIALHGNKVVPAQVLGLKSGNKTLGHRFLSKGPVVIARATDYESTLEKKGKVFVSFEQRRALIKKELERAELELARIIATKSGGRVPPSPPRIIVDTERAELPQHIFPRTPNSEAIDRAVNCSGGSALLDEVTALVEWPRAYYGHFDVQFLNVPVECLALTMKQNQKYFPAFDQSAELMPYFVVIGNNEGNERTQVNIVSGNERVVRPRLADARFFFQQDKKVRLEARVPQLSSVVFHAKLGSQLERTTRIQLLAGQIARELKANVQFAERAAWLAKADLLTGMVGEFPELQGVMGRYYASADLENEIVANAIEAHYRPKFAGDKLPVGHVACSVSLSDKLDTLVGIYGIGLAPTGDKDPFGLRRAAVGVIRVLMEKSLPLDLLELIEHARQRFPRDIISSTVTQDLRMFFMDRLRPYLRDRGYAPDEIEAVLALNPTRLDRVVPRLEALQKFRALPEGMALAAANKRIHNILRQAGKDAPDVIKPEEWVTPALDGSLLQEAAEKELCEQLAKVITKIEPLVASGDYDSALKELASLRGAVDMFFDEVMVMAEDQNLRVARLQLLAVVRSQFYQIADVSRLQG